MKRGRRGILRRGLAKDPNLLTEIAERADAGATADEIADWICRDLNLPRPDRSSVCRWLKRIHSSQEPGREPEPDGQE